MFKHLLLGAIRIYRKHLSPRKGYRCAYGAATGRTTCSTVGLRAVRRAGAWRGLLLLGRQFDRCTLARAAMAETAPVEGGRYLAHRMHSQAGMVDCDVGGCDGPDCSPGPGLDCWDCTPKGGWFKHCSWTDFCDVCSCLDGRSSGSRPARASARQGNRQRKRDERRAVAAKPPEVTS